MALIVCFAVLGGWATGSLGIAGFGRREIFMQPWTAIACIALSLSFLGAAMGRFRLSRIVAAIPLAIALTTLAREWVHVPLAIDQALFWQTVQHQPRLYPGRPGVMPAVATLLLTLASLATTCRHGAVRQIITGLCCTAFCIAILSGTILPLGFTTLGLANRCALMSVPTASTLIALSIAIMAQRRHIAWPKNPSCGVGSRTLQWLLAPCILLPVLSALWQLWIGQDGRITPEMAEIIQAAGQVVISCAVIAWAWIRIGRESTSRWAFSTAIDSAPIAIIDVDGRIIRWSKGCERLYGWTAAEAKGRDKYRLTDARLPPGPNRPLQPDAPQETTITERHRDGSRLRILESRQIVQPRPDILPMIVLSMTDITERERAEEAKLASEARLAFAADLHELGLFEWTATADRLILSPHAEKLFGYPPGTATGGMEAWRRHVRHHFGTDILSDEPLPRFSPHRRTFRLSTAGKDPRQTVEGSIFFHEAPGQQGCSMLGIIMDATEREKRTEMLKAREVELQSILETVPEAMITIDEAGLVRSFSTAAERLFGYASEEIAGRDIRTLLPDYAAAADQERTERGPIVLSPFAPKITAGRDRDGNAMPVELVVGETTIGREHISIAFVRSLREQIATQTRLNELRDQLLHAARVSTMGEMGAGLAHELNQPLTAAANLLGAAHIRLGMKGDGAGSPDQIRELVELANLEVLRAGEIIRRMRAFVARGELNIRALALNELIVDALQLAFSGTHRAHVQLHYHPSPSAPAVLADPIQIQQVLVNIISNALEAFVTHGTDRPEIVIRVIERPDGDVLIRLLDNGPGFPPAIIGRPFEAFVSTRANGLGLGLSICRRIVEGHGGILTFANRPEGGAIIEFTLPIYREADVRAAE